MKDVPETPAWVEAFKAKYSAGVAHVFLLHFNTSDYVDSTHLLRLYLAKLLTNREVVVFYNRSAGITFATPEMEEKFLNIAGLASAPTDPALVALQAIGQSGQGTAPLPREPSQALPLLEQLLHSRAAGERGAAVVLDFVETLAPNADFGLLSAEDRTSIITLLRWASEETMTQAGVPVVLVTQNLTDVHAALRAASSRIEALLVPIPNRAQRLAYIEFLLDTHPNLRLEMSPQQLANMTAGLKNSTSRTSN